MSGYMFKIYTGFSFIHAIIYALDKKQRIFNGNLSIQPNIIWNSEHSLSYHEGNLNMQYKWDSIIKKKAFL